MTLSPAAALRRTRPSRTPASATVSGASKPTAISSNGCDAAALPPAPPVGSTALHHAVLGRLLLNFFSALARGSDWAASLAVRDAIMAENLRHILHGLRGRLLVHAHNQHLLRGQAVWQVGPAPLTWWSAGAHLHATIGERYAVIGTALGASEENGIAPPEPGTLETRLTALAGPGRWIALRHAALGAEALAVLPFRSGSAKNPTYFPLTPRLLSGLDALAVLDTVTCARGGRSLG